MKPIFLFNDKQSAGKQQLIDVIVQGLQNHYGNVYNIGDNYNENLSGLKSGTAAIFFHDVKLTELQGSFLNDQEFSFSELLTYNDNQGHKVTIHIPQLVFVCEFAKEELIASMNEIDVISVE